MNHTLRQAVREQEERDAEATAAIVDSQTVKTTEAAMDDRGYDGGKQTTGRKRFILVDVMGLLLTVFVTKGNVPERQGAQQMLEQASPEILAHLELLWADGGFSGPDFATWVYEHCGAFVEIVKRPDDARGFVILLAVGLSSVLWPGFPAFAVSAKITNAWPTPVRLGFMMLWSALCCRGFLATFLSTTKTFCYRNLTFQTRSNLYFCDFGEALASPQCENLG